MGAARRCQCVSPVPTLKQCPLLGPCWSQDARQSVRALMEMSVHLKASAEPGTRPKASGKSHSQSSISSNGENMLPKGREGAGVNIC